MRQFKWLGTNRLSQVLKDWVQNDGGYETIGSLYCTTYDFSLELSFDYSDYKREVKKNKEARQWIRVERKEIFGEYFHLSCKPLYIYSGSF